MENILDRIVERKRERLAAAQNGVPLSSLLSPPERKPERGRFEQALRGDGINIIAEIKRAFVGDVLFAGSIGRTDFPRGNHQDLIDSITQRLWPMGDDTVFIPGHGPESTFGRERRSNPYVGGT